MADQKTETAPTALEQGPVIVRDRYGASFSVEPGELNDILGMGYRLETPEEQAAEAKRLKYGEGFGNEAKAFGAGVGRGATFGLSDQLLTKTGLVDPETLKGLQEENPTASIAGEVVGTVAPMFLPGAGGANLVKGVSRLGMGAERLAAEAVGTGAKSLLGRAVQAAAPKAVGSAVEGAFYSAGHVVTEQALGDPDLNGQSAISQIGLGALLGGALGGAVGLGEAFIPPAVAAAKEGLGKVLAKGRDEFVDNYPKAFEALSKMEGSGEKVSQLLRNRHAPAADKDAVIREMASTLEEQHATINKALKAANKEVRGDEMRSLLADADVGLANGKYVEVRTQLDDLVKTMRAEPDLYPQSYARKLELIDGGLERDLKRGVEHSPADVHERLNSLKRQLDDDIKYGKMPTGAEQDAQAAVKELRFKLKTALEDESVWGQAGVRQAAFNDAQANLLRTQKEFQKTFMRKTITPSGGVSYKMDPSKVTSFYTKAGTPVGDLRAKTLDDFVDASRRMVDEIEASYKAAAPESFDRSVLDSLSEKGSKQAADLRSRAALEQFENDLGAKSSGIGGLLKADIALDVARDAGLNVTKMVPGAGTLIAGYQAAKTLMNPPAAVRALAKVERAIQATDRVIDSGVSAIVKGGARASYIGRGEISAGLSREFGQDADSSARTFERRVAQIDKMAASPDLMQEELERSVAGIHSHAPRIVAAMHSAKVRAIPFLSSKVPRPPSVGVKPIKWTPSPAEIGKFNRYYKTVEKPLSVLKQAAAGTLTKESVEAMEVVYPDLLQKIRVELATKMAESKKDVPYRSRPSISLLLGTPIDSSMTPRSIASNQMSYAESVGEPEQGPGPDESVSGISLAQRSSLQTGMA